MLRRLAALPCTIALVVSSLAVGAATSAQAKPAAKPMKPAMGAAANSQAEFDKLNRGTNMTVRRTYDGALPTSFARSRAASDVAAKRTSYWSYKPNPHTFGTDKRAQAAFSKFLDTIPKGHQTVITLWHEPEDNIHARQFTLKQWGAMNTAAGKIIDAKKRSELKLAICLMGAWTFDTRSPYHTYDWARAIDMRVVDIVGIDPYKLRTTVGSLERMLTVPNYGLGGKAKSTMQRLEMAGKPVAFMEWGITTKDVKNGAGMSDAERAKWIADGYAWIKRWNAANTRAKIIAVMYFHLVHNGNTVALSNEALTAWKRAQADSKQ